MTPRSGVRSVTGRRAHNEDAVLALSCVFAVADGMGGHEHGEVASALVVDALAGLAEREGLTGADVSAVLRAAGERVGALGGARGAGSTVTGACLIRQDGRPYWLVFNVGDSRTYRLAAGQFEQITVDHSEWQEMVAAGRTEDLPPRNVITRAIGAAAAEVDFWLLPVGVDDRLMLCSDGLTGAVADDEIAQVLREVADPGEAAHTLADRAIAAGSRDNVTVLVVDAGAEEELLDTVPSGAGRGSRR